MFADENPCHIACFVPCRFAGHVVGDNRTIDAEVLEADVSYQAVAVVADDVRQFGMCAVVSDILEQDVLDASSGSGTILLIIENAEVDQLSPAEILDADILETYVTHQVVVACIDCQAALVIYLFS